jgi:hypothetical protein
MGETLAETRVEVDAQRQQVEQTAEQLKARVRYLLDFKARFRDNPLLFVGIAGGTIFLVTGGPVRTARLLRRRIRPTTQEKAYDALPSAMQKWVDSVVEDYGPRAERARETLAEEIVKWRLGPLKNKKARKQLAKVIAEGPPGPSRAGWKAAETALTIITAALARRAVEAMLSGRRPADASPMKEAPPEYSGMSRRAP